MSNRNEIKIIFVQYIIVLLGAGFLYVVSCAPGVLWQDSGMYQYRIWHNDIEGELGLALAHPLYHLIGMGVKQIPLGGFAYRVNLISVWAGALAVANIFLLLRLWLRQVVPALVGAITLAVSWTFWQQSCMAEVYTLWAALFLGELAVLLQYYRSGKIGYLYILGLLNGLALANHMWASLALVCYVVLLAALFIKKQIRVGQLVVIILLWIVGALPYEYLIIKNIIETGDVWGTLLSATFGNTYQGRVLNAHISLKMVKENCLFFGLNFPTPNVLLFLVGLFSLKKVAPRGGWAYLLVGLSVIFFGFAFRYTVPDRYVFFLPFYCLVAIMIGVGSSLVVRLKPKIIIPLVIIFSLAPMGVYAGVSDWTKQLGFKIPTKRQIPYRDDYKWFLQPWRSGYRGPEQFAHEALKAVEHKAIIYADGTTVYALLYAQEVEGKRRDVLIVSSHGSVDNLQKYDDEVIAGLLERRAVYVVSPVEGYCPADWLSRFNFVRAGILWRVKPKPGDSGFVYGSRFKRETLPAVAPVTVD